MTILPLKSDTVAKKSPEKYDSLAYFEKRKLPT